MSFYIRVRRPRKGDFTKGRMFPYDSVRSAFEAMDRIIAEGFRGEMRVFDEHDNEVERPKGDRSDRA